jgi:hypothetical protein
MNSYIWPTLAAKDAEQCRGEHMTAHCTGQRGSSERNVGNGPKADT